VWGQEKKNKFFFSPINSRKEGRKKRELFYPRRYIAASGGATSENPRALSEQIFFRIIKMRMIFKFKKM
jgi:ribose 1,5-bisphosphokinase PhnN